MTSSLIAPAPISPRRAVPAHIPRPEYVDKPAPARYAGSEVKDADTIERMRVAGRLAAQVGHSDGMGPNQSTAGSLSSWNSAHANQNCANTAPRGGAGRIYCFAR